MCFLAVKDPCRVLEPVHNITPRGSVKKAQKRRNDLAEGPQELAPRVYLVGGPGLTHALDCLVYAIDGGEEIGLVDTGSGRNVRGLIENLKILGLGRKPLGPVILTHCHVDHIGGVAAIQREVSGCRILCHQADQEPIEKGDPNRTASKWYGITLGPVKVDRVLIGEEELIELGELELRCIHTPGHTPGSISILMETGREKILFGQDLHGPFSPEFGSDLSQWASSMRKLLALKADTICEGHYGVLRPAKEVRDFILKQLSAHGFEENEC